MAKTPSPTSDLPLYNIGAVTRLTGIPITTLHAWDRRYGFPHASRTAGGHRLYSENDVARLRWVKAQIGAGLATHSAVLAAQSRDKERETVQAAPAQPESTATLLAPLPALRQQLAQALLRGELDRSDQLFGDMLAFYTPEELTLNVIGPILHEIGEAWAAAQISVTAEHLASSYLRQRLLMWTVSAPRPRPGRPVVLACAPGEWHDGSLLMLAVLLRRQGVPVAYLGQNVPLADLSRHIRENHPAAAVLVAMQAKTAQALADWPKQLNADSQDMLFAFGGRAFVARPELQKTVPGAYLGDTIQGGFKRLLDLLGWEKSS